MIEIGRRMDFDPRVQARRATGIRRTVEGLAHRGLAEVVELRIEESRARGTGVRMTLGVGPRPGAGGPERACARLKDLVQESAGGVKGIEGDRSATAARTTGA